MIKIANAQFWVHDQDEALAFYIQKLGWEVRADVTVEEWQFPLAGGRSDGTGRTRPGPYARTRAAHAR